MIILVGGEKGGSGKSCIAQNIAVFLTTECSASIIMVDCGGQDNLALRATMSVASHVLMPLRPKRRDLKTVNHMDDIVATCMMINPKMRASFVITQCPNLPSQANRILEAKEVCRTYDINVLYQSV
jgi:chromosome partitioning protein